MDAKQVSVGFCNEFFGKRKRSEHLQVEKFRLIALEVYRLQITTVLITLETGSSVIMF
jgi:hypothetical protein